MPVKRKAYQISTMRKPMNKKTKALSWLSMTYHGNLVRSEMQNHSAHYSASYPQREGTNMNPTSCDKDILHPFVNCTSIILLQHFRALLCCLPLSSSSLSCTCMKW